MFLAIAWRVKQIVALLHFRSDFSTRPHWRSSLYVSSVLIQFSKEQRQSLPKPPYRVTISTPYFVSLPLLRSTVSSTLHCQKNMGIKVADVLYYAVHFGELRNIIQWLEESSFEC